MENWLIKRAALTPNRVAIQYENKKLTFQEVLEQAIEMAEKIAFVAENDPRIALIMNNTLTGYLAIMALQQLGKTIVFINRRLSADEINYQLSNAGIHTVLTDDNYIQILRVNRQIKFSDLSLRKTIVPVVTFDDNFVTSIMYTSGTTSQPKGVMQTFQNHFYSAMASALNLEIRAEDSWLAVVPIFHISGFSIVMRGLIYGMRVVLQRKFDAHQINNLLVHENITTMSVVPVMLKQLLVDLPSEVNYNKKFRAMLLGGGPTDLLTLQQAKNHRIPVIQSYGMTETASQVVALDSTYAEQKIGSVGKPLFPVRLKIADQTGKNTQQGNIWIQTPTLTIGYLNQPDKLAEKMVDGWFNTEDYGYIDDEGFLFVQGREGDMINSGGENIFPNEVEDIYADYQGLEKIAIIGVLDDKWGSVPVAIVQGKNLQVEQLIQFGRRRIAHYKVPKRFYIADTWHTTASGKTQRNLFLAEIERLKELK
ncbi:2-succinylbenzoate--CoA ligase [Leuconostoc litchii]|uniref:2-succinylbenzoate--CoA ligase n=1 Tax=Leuconostoc litchii TaxID=1981069 RepID=A0A6P2CLD2_9LACO|nr:o-succinylbenzoate--CoA ligase [Leuconostoc litchii]TYC46078.1 o-succinylbenzoate--CoA ligase [Leuconostoc litchii]GMA69842.1 2-succinylbenzoate--CoA ligase [Leuconostoc litchii]